MGEDVSTSMDQLLQLLRERESVKISEAANLLDTTKSHVESWSNMLEKEGILKVHYSVIGGAILQRGPKFDTMSDKKAQKSEKENKAPEPASAPLKEEKAAPEEKTIKADDPPKDLSPKDYLLIRKKIETGENYLEKDLEKLKEEQKKIIAYLSALIEDSNKLTQYIEALHKLVGDTKKSREVRKPEVVKATK